jgi:uncharacterized repeat protein (TIGR01451 family)
MKIHRLLWASAVTAAVFLGVYALLPPETSAFERPPRTTDIQCVLKTQDTSKLFTDGTISYSIQLKNNGTATATGVALNDNLPLGTLVSKPAICDTNDPMTCAVGNVGAGATVNVGPIVMSLLTFPLTPGPYSFTNTASVTSTSTDTTPSNNGGPGTACEVRFAFQVEEHPDLMCVAKTVDKQSIVENLATTLTYNVTARNIGAGQATNVEITDILPNQVTFNGGLSSPTCTELLGVVTCPVGTLAPAAQATRTIVVNVPALTAPDTIFNEARVDGDGDVDVTNNNGPVCTAETSVEQQGTEGCTPGFWKQRQHFDSWPAPYDPPDNFDATFGVTYFGAGTLIQALNVSNNKILQHGTAALLSAASGGVDYPYSVAEVILAVQDAVNGTSIGTLTIQDLNDANDLGCPLN